MAKKDDWEKLEMSPTWDYKNNKQIIGVFKRMESGVGPNNSNIYYLETEDGVIGVWGTTLLDARLKNLNIGEEVKLVYLGEKPSPNRKGKNYHDFDIYHRVVPMTKVEDDASLPEEEE